MTKEGFIEEIEKERKWLDSAGYNAYNIDVAFATIIKEAKEQEPKTGHCKECKYFEYDSFAKVDGIPLIVAHEICSRWGDGCKTSENGFCFLFEPKAESEGI